MVIHYSFFKKALVFFPLGQRDINPIFKVADGVYGRSKEIEILKTIINRTSQSHKAGFEKMKNQAANPPESDNAALNEADMLLRRGNTTSSVNDECEIVVLQGPGGIGKSTLISTIHVHARQYGYTAVAKFDKNQKQPYNGLLRCLSAILRQLLTESETVIKEFYDVLKRDLGPQFANLRLMVNMVPELKPILYGERDIVQEEEDFISNSETRFHSVSQSFFVLFLFLPSRYTMSKQFYFIQ
jgi:predicted ATPase